MKSVIAFLSGLSGTGKTTLVQYFREHPVEGWLIFDFDEGNKPVPKDREGHHEWRKEQSEWWLHQCIENAQKGKKTAVFGLALYPSAMKTLAIAQQIGNDHIHFALLHAEHEVRKSRIMQRENTGAWQGIQPWYEEFYREMKIEGTRVIDTSSVALKDTIKEVSEWLLEL
jgi:dephospho-CoA kinase